MTATAGILLLCTAGLGSAHSAEAAVTAAPAPGSAPLYVSDYTAGKVLRLPRTAVRRQRSRRPG